MYITIKLTCIWGKIFWITFPKASSGRKSKDNMKHMDVSKNTGTPQLKWMIWGYPYFRKHPYLGDRESHPIKNPSTLSTVALLTYAFASQVGSINSWCFFCSFPSLIREKRNFIIYRGKIFQGCAELGIFKLTLFFCVNNG